jgi:hypothetical protein
MNLMKGAIFRAVIARKEEKELSWSEMLDVDKDSLRQEAVAEPMITFTEFIRALSVRDKNIFLTSRSLVEDLLTKKHDSRSEF